MSFKMDLLFEDERQHSLKETIQILEKSPEISQMNGMQRKQKGY